MALHPLRKELMSNPIFNPFNDKFDFKEICEHLAVFAQEVGEDEFENNIETKELAFTCLATQYFSGIGNFYSEIKADVKANKTGFDDTLAYLIAMVNRQTMLAQEIVEKNIENKKEVHYSDLYRVKIDSVDSTMGKLDINSAQEISIDTINWLFTFLKYSEAEINANRGKEENELKVVSTLLKMFLVSNYLVNLKSCYDDCIWHGGIAKVSEDKSEVSLIIKDEEFLKIRRIGFFRLRRNIMAMTLVATEKINSNHPTAQLMRNIHNEHKTERRIKKTKIENGVVKYELAKGIDKREILLELEFQSAVATYYPFLEFNQLPNFTGFSLLDLARLYWLFQHLMRQASIDSFTEDDSVMNLNDFGKFPFKISEDSLFEYLSRRSDYSGKQIKEFINVISTRKGERINFWNTPIYRTESRECYIPLLTSVHPNILNLIDYWIDKGGIDLDTRGKLLETYLKNTLLGVIVKKGYSCKIPKISKFEVSKNRFEEIDLIIVLKTIVILAEVKCIKYPMEIRDEHNAIKRLSKGGEQIKRKSKFISENSGIFAGELGDISNKEIVEIIVTNYPCFTGLKLGGIPIVDIFALEAYFSHGKLTKMAEGIKQRKHFTKVVGEESFYNNEDEMNANFKFHMENPPAVEEIKPLLEINMKKMTTEDSEIDIFLSVAEFIEM